MKNRKELNNNIGSKSLHQFVHRLLVPSVKQQAAKNMSQQNCLKPQETVLDSMPRICVAIWETREWPKEWTFSTFIPLRKKGDLKQCANYSEIALVSHASKILLRIILEIIRVKTETEIADEQAGFQQERGQETKKSPNHESQNTDAQYT